MTHIMTTFSQLRRPRILIRAARMGVSGYRRQAHLPRLLGYGSVPRSLDALTRLLSLESVLNEERRSGVSSYTVARHVDVLIAMMGEARILRASHPDLSVVASAADAQVPATVPCPALAAEPGAQLNASGIEAFLRAT